MSNDLIALKTLTNTRTNKVINPGEPFQLTNAKHRQYFIEKGIAKKAPAPQPAAKSNPPSAKDDANKTAKGDKS